LRVSFDYDENGNRIERNSGLKNSSNSEDQKAPDLGLIYSREGLRKSVMYCYKT